VVLPRIRRNCHGHLCVAKSVRSQNAKICLFATFRDDFDRCETQAPRLYIHSVQTNSQSPGTKDKPMLYIFKKKNAVQIAWGSTAPRNELDTRLQQLDTTFGALGFIRTRNAG